MSAEEIIERLNKVLKYLAPNYRDTEKNNIYKDIEGLLDLYKEIEKAYEYEKSIFDDISKDDLIMAFFPCIRFEDQIQMHFRGVAFQMKNWDNIQKLERTLNYIKNYHSYMN